MIRRAACWFRGHRWQYDRHIWGTRIDPHDRFVCEVCGIEFLEASTSASTGEPLVRRESRIPV